MKTYKNLYPQITDFSSLYQAWCKARCGKRYKSTASAFERNLDAELTVLHQELSDESWQPGGFRSFTVHEPKRRHISAAPFPNALYRIIQLGASRMQAARVLQVVQVVVDCPQQQFTHRQQPDQWMRQTDAVELAIVPLARSLNQRGAAVFPGL